MEKELAIANISKLFQYALMYWLHLSMQENYTKLHEQIILHLICKKLSKRNMPKHPQRNPNQRPRSNKRNPVGDFGVYSNRNTPAGIPTNREDIENDSRYHINFLVGILIRSCNGCVHPICLPPYVPPPPYDIVICQKEYRTYTNKVGQLKFTLQP